MKEIYEQIKQEGIDISKIVQKKATKLKNKLVADITSHKRQEVLEDLLQIYRVWLIVESCRSSIIY